MELLLLAGPVAHAAAVPLMVHWYVVRQLLGLVVLLVLVTFIGAQPTKLDSVNAGTGGDSMQTAYTMVSPPHELPVTSVTL